MPSEQQMVVAKTNHYIALHGRFPKAYPLTQERVAAYEDGELGYCACARQTLVNHGCDRLIREAKRQRQPRQERNETDATIQRLQAEVVDYKHKYHTVLERLRLIEVHLQQSPHVDLDRIYNDVAMEMRPPEARRRGPKKGGRTTASTGVAQLRIMRKR